MKKLIGITRSAHAHGVGDRFGSMEKLLMTGLVG